MKSNGLVKSMWIDSVIGDIQVLCLNSFVLNNVDFHLYTYNEITNVPEGIVVKDANEILDRSLIFLDNKGSYATFSDWFRIKLLYDVGGWWVDCDVVWIKKFNFRSPYVFSTEHFYHNEKLEVRICNAVIKMPKKSIVGEKILSRIQNKLAASDVKEISWTEIGAGFLRDELIDEGLDQYIVIPEVFCPNAWNTFVQVSSNENLRFDERTYAVHLWNKMWEWNGINPLDMIVEGSFLHHEKLKCSSLKNNRVNKEC